MHAFRQTAEASATKLKGILAVEMEAAALYAFTRSAGARLYYLAHVNMGQRGADFEKAKTTTSTITREIRGIIVFFERGGFRFISYFTFAIVCAQSGKENFRR